ncbi:helix-turn-helix domain-containing protein [Paenibacillus aestuarii]|uniref:Helix-turn-helix domain-containing protein n=1 Tax=Paenibacillus aestuarii TaxID=516965 RepID=A0ABW0KF23_9BACL|nr:helix-turn-helix domain-containing protein [Paenibacillus aestuarii]
MAELTILADHFLKTDTYVTARPSGMEDWLLTLTLNGEGYFITSGQERICQAGDVTLLKPGTPHQYGTRKGSTWDFVWAHFPPSLTETNLLPEQELLQFTVESESVRLRIYQALIRVIGDSRERGEYWYDLCCNALKELLLVIAQRTSNKIDSRIEEVIHLLTRQMRSQIRIEELAKAVGLSPSRLSHLFKDSTGYSIVDMQNRMRIQQAALLLEHTDRSASEVCYDVGYQNYNHFTNQFRKWHGMNPSSFMKNKR